MLEDLNNVYDFKFHYYGDKISQRKILLNFYKKFIIRFCTNGFKKYLS